MTNTQLLADHNEMKAGNQQLVADYKKIEEDHAALRKHQGALTTSSRGYRSRPWG